MPNEDPAGPHPDQLFSAPVIGCGAGGIAP